LLSSPIFVFRLTSFHKINPVVTLQRYLSAASARLELPFGRAVPFEGSSLLAP